MKRRILATAAAATLAACASAPVVQHSKMTDAELAEVTAAFKRDFRAKGQAKMERLEQDEVQRTCNLQADNPPESVAKPLEQAQLKAIKFPNGSFMGDWKNGKKIAESGQGMQWSEKPGTAGGGCYNCHQLSPQQESRHARAEPEGVRQSPRQRPGNAEVRVRQDLQFKGLQSLLAHAALRSLRLAHRAADQGCCRLPGRPEFSREQVTRRPLPAGGDAAAAEAG